MYMLYNSALETKIANIQVSFMPVIGDWLLSEIRGGIERHTFDRMIKQENQRCFI